MSLDCEALFQSITSTKFSNTSFVMTKSAAAQTRSMNSAKEKWSLAKNGFHKVQKIRK